MKMLFVILLIAGALIYAGNHGAFKRDFVEHNFAAQSSGVRENQPALGSPSVSSVEAFTKTNASSGTIKDGSEISIAKNKVIKSNTKNATYSQNDESDPYSARNFIKSLTGSSDSSRSDTEKTSNSKQEKDEVIQEVTQEVNNDTNQNAKQEANQEVVQEVGQTEKQMTKQEIEQESKSETLTSESDSKTLAQQLSAADSFAEVLAILKNVVAPKNETADHNDSNQDTQSSSLSLDKTNTNSAIQSTAGAFPTSPSDHNPVTVPPKVEEVKKDTLVIVLPVDTANTQTNTSGGVVTIKSSSASNALLSICQSKYQNAKDVRIVNQTTSFDLATKTAQSMMFEVECIQ